MVAAIKLLHLLEAFSTPWFLFSSPSNHHLVFFLLEIFNNIIQYQFDGNANLVYTIIRKRHVFHALANLPADLSAISRCLSSRATKGDRSRGGFAASRLPVSPSTTALRKAAQLQRAANVAAAAAVAAAATGVQPASAERAGDLGRRASTDTEASSAADGDARSEAGDISMEGSRPAQPAEPGTLNVTLMDTPDFRAMTEHESPHPELSPGAGKVDLVATTAATFAAFGADDEEKVPAIDGDAVPELDSSDEADDADAAAKPVPGAGGSPLHRSVAQRGSIRVTPNTTAAQSSPQWTATPEWVASWRARLPLQTIMRLLQVLVPQVEKICIDK